MFKRLGATLMAVTMAASMAMPVCAADVTRAGSDIITKTVKFDNGATFNEEFVFNFQQEGTYDGVTDEGNGTSDSGVIANKIHASIPSVKISMSADKTTNYTQNTNEYAQSAGLTAQTGEHGSAEAIDLSNLNKAGVYTYIVYESTGGIEGVWDNDLPKYNQGTGKYEGTRYRMRVYVTNKAGGGLNKEITMVEVDGEGNDIGDKLQTAGFVNRLAKKAYFYIEKKVDGGTSYIPEGTTYSYKVTFNFDDLNEEVLNIAYDTEFDYTIIDTSYNVLESGKVKSGDTITDLPANCQIRIANLPVGATVITEEVNNPENVASTKYSAYVGRDESREFIQTESAVTGTTTSAVLIDENDSKVEFTNTWKDVTVTGIVTNNAPYIAMVVLAGAAVAGYVILKRKIAR